MHDSEITACQRDCRPDAALGRAWGSRDEVNFTDPVNSGCRVLSGDSENGQRSDLRSRNRAGDDLRRRAADARRLTNSSGFSAASAKNARRSFRLNGWRLFTPNESLARLIDGMIPTASPITGILARGASALRRLQSGARPCEAERGHWRPRTSRRASRNSGQSQPGQRVVLSH
jgi:hypothetical protein